MKRLLLFLALLLPLSALAGNDNSRKKLVGVWQQVQKSEADNHLMLLPVWKVIQADGNFCTFLIANQSGVSIMTNQGTYQVTSDSTCVEAVKGSITDPELIGKHNTLTLHFVSDDLIEVSYRMPGARHDGHETWRRVKLELPAE